ncbi:hypothetical protein PoHVEF18_008562 [Penicillium ochrochloron]
MWVEADGVLDATCYRIIGGYWGRCWWRSGRITRKPPYFEAYTDNKLLIFHILYILDNINVVNNFRVRNDPHCIHN